MMRSRGRAERRASTNAWGLAATSAEGMEVSRKICPSSKPQRSKLTVPGSMPITLLITYSPYILKFFVGSHSARLPKFPKDLANENQLTILKCVLLSKAAP
jgi:hypothetical protein